MKKDTSLFKYIKDYRESYLYQLKEYLDKEQQYCLSNPNGYSKITIPYINEIKNEIDSFFPKESEKEKAPDRYEKRDFKYNDFIEAYRLIKYQYSKYSNTYKSLVEGVYSSVVLEILKNKPQTVHNILDCGCGPSRLTYELSCFYPEADFTLLDFSYINLFFAEKLLTSGQDLVIPVKAFESSDINNIIIKTKTIKKLNRYIFNLDELSPDSFNNKFDIITASHSVNLLTDPLKTVSVMARLLKPNGIMVISDLLGWKENRNNLRRVFYNKECFFEKISKIPDLTVLHKESGGPYCEEVNAERYDFYTNHFIVLRKDS